MWHWQFAKKFKNFTYFNLNVNWKYMQTRKHSSRMGTTRLPTVSHCIPCLLGDGYALDIPTPRHTHPQTYPPPGLLPTPDIPAPDIPTPPPPEGTYFQRYPPTPVDKETCENITFQQLRWRMVIKKIWQSFDVLISFRAVPTCSKSRWGNSEYWL